MSRWVAATWWMVLTGIAFRLGPPPRDDELAWVTRLLAWQIDGEEPWVVVHFMAMGLWPFILGALARDRLFAPLRRVPAPAYLEVPGWPFAIGSVALGAFALLGWGVLGLPQERGTVPRGIRWLGDYRLAFGLLVAAIGLGGFGLAEGNLGRWWTVFVTERFVWAMAFDFGSLWFLSALAMRETRQWDPQAPSPWWSVLPLYGALIWLFLDGWRRRSH